MAFSWTYLDNSATVLEATDDNSLTATGFPTQADAEAWLGETWQDLADDGVDAVTLFEDGVAVYGPMSLKP